MDRLRNSIADALREAERRSQPPTATARPSPPPPRRILPIDREGQEAEPGGARTAPPSPPVPSSPPARPLGLRATLGSRAALRQAFLLREILGPPRALQDPHGEGRV